MKKILCLTSHDLNAPDYGSVLRARNVFRLLARFGQVRVVVAGPCKNVIAGARSPQAGFELLEKIYFAPVDRRTIADRLHHEFNPHFLKMEWREAAAQHRERMKSLIAEHDLIWVHSLQVANNFGIWRWPKTILDIDDVPSNFHRLHFAQAQGPLEKFQAFRQMVRWRRHEKFLAERFDALCVCSRLDRQKFGNLENFFVLPNGFAMPEKAPRRNPATPPQIGFVGTFKYRPNGQGVRWFVEKIWPLILRKIPRARLRLAGDGSENFAGGQNIDPLGWLGDLESEMAKWSLAIVPLLIGAGTRIKILEAFSRKCPVVSTFLGAYGHDVENGRDLLLADSPKDFAAHCLHLLANPAAGERLAESAWKKFLENWTWDSHENRVAGLVETIFGKQTRRFARNEMTLTR